MVEVYVYKLNGWPDTFEERILHLSKHVDHLTLIRSKPEAGDSLDDLPNVTVYEAYPSRGSFMSPAVAPFVYALHVLQGVIYSILASYRDGSCPDVVHSLDYVLGGLAALFGSKLCGSSLVVSVRGLKEPQYERQAEKRGSLAAFLKYRILTVLSGTVLGEADHLITKAEYQRGYLRDNFGTSVEISTVPTGVDFEKFDSSRVDTDGYLRDEFGLDEGKEVFLFLGKIAPHKGVDTLLNSLIQVRNEVDDDTVFHIVGEYANHELQNEVEALSTKLGEVVHIHPERISFDEVPLLLDAVDGLILLSESDTEGAPRVIQEALAMETPVIASDVTGIGDVFEEIDGVDLIDRDSPRQLIEAVKGVKAEQRETGREDVARRFDIASNYSRYGEIYNRLSG